MEDIIVYAACAATALVGLTLIVSELVDRACSWIDRRFR